MILLTPLASLIFGVPMHSIVRIDEVERMGTPKISEAKGVSNIMPFPMPMPDK